MGEHEVRSGILSKASHCDNARLFQSVVGFLNQKRCDPLRYKEHSEIQKQIKVDIIFLVFSSSSDYTPIICLSIIKSTPQYGLFRKKKFYTELNHYKTYLTVSILTLLSLSASHSILTDILKYLKLTRYLPQTHN